MFADSSTHRSRWPLWGGFVVFVVVFVYFWSAQHRGYVVDDAGITLRYAERIALGKGFNYNDGEAVNGASNPLYVLCQAALLRAGFAPAQVILAIASFCFAASAALLFATMARFYSLGAALFGVFAMLVFDSPYDAVTDGMETPLVGLLVVVCFRALHGGGWWFPGLALGLLVSNKLDGALAAIAFTLVHLAARRGFPWRVAWTALATATPMCILLWVHFGSPVPNSMTTKLTDHAFAENHWVMEHTWMHELLRSGHGGVMYWCALASLAWWPLSRDIAKFLPVCVVQLWFVLHLLVFSTVSLGGDYGWYAAAPRFQAVILSAFAVHVFAYAIFKPGRWPRVELDASRTPRRAAWIMCSLLAALIVFRGERALARLRPAEREHGNWPSVTWDLARQSAGAWLRKHTSGTELLSTYEGLPAFEYVGPCYDESRLNSVHDNTRLEAAAYRLIGPVRLAVGEGLPFAEPRGNGQLVASFRYDAADQFYLLFARPGSELERSDARHIVFPTPVPRITDALGLRREAPGDGDNTWRLPAASTTRFELDSALVPTLSFVLALRLETELALSASDTFRIAVRCNGAEVFARELGFGEAREHVAIVLSRAQEGRYALEIECRSNQTDASDALSVELQRITLRHGEPVRTADFKLMVPRCAQRIESVAETGLPWRLYAE